MPPGSEPTGQFREWQQVHPASPFLNAGRLGIVAVILVAQNGLSRQAAGVSVIGLGLLVLVILAYAYLAWRNRRFRIGDDQLEYRSGIIFREVRRLPIARIEAVEVVQPALARLLGLSEVRVQAAGSGESEIALQYVQEAIAWQVRDELKLARRDLAPAQTPTTEAPAANVTGEVTQPADEIVDEQDLVQEGRDLFSVSNSDLFWGYIAARAILPAIFLLIGVIIAVTVSGPAALGGAVPAAFGIASFIFATFKSAEANYNFTIYEHPDGLFIHRGLLNKLTQRVSLDRVQSIAVQEPYLWRKFGRARVLVDIAGFRSRSAAQGAESAILIPIAKRDECLAVIERLLPNLVFTDAETVTAPPQARWLEPIGRPFLKLGKTASSVVSTFGVVRRITVVVPHQKVQSWRLTAGPIQQRLGLATVHLDTAGSHVVFAAKHRGRKEAEALIEASRQATHSA